MGQVNRLPSHFPNGTRYVIEGRAGRIVSRYLEFPDGRHIELPAEPTEARLRARRHLRKTATRKPS
jgi:hypothetical protein